jgi:integrase/recombinase XerD
MHNLQKPSIASSGSFGPLSPYTNAYLVQIKEQGYAVGSINEQLRVLKMFGRWLERKGQEVAGLNEEIIRDFLRRIKHSYSDSYATPALRRLLSVLRQIGATPEAKAAPPSPFEQLTCSYERFLLQERNLASQSVTRLRLIASRFLAETFGAGPLNLSELTAAEVTGFVQQQAPRHPSSSRNLVGGTRSFLRYLHYKGLVHTDLSLAVPKVANWALSTLPKHLPAAQVRKVLCHCDRSTGLGRRNYAILLLLARLGLRAGEVVRLDLEDIDWEAARIKVCGKGQQWAQLPLPADAARAIASYLRRDRPRCACRRVFIRHHAPIQAKGWPPAAPQSGDRDAAQGSLYRRGR